MLAGSGLGTGDSWRPALETALTGALAPLEGNPPDLLLVFASAAYEPHFADLLDAAALTGTAELVGCSAWAVIGGTRELERQPGVAALALKLPTHGELSVRYVAPGDVHATDLASLGGAECTGLIVLADPFSTDIAALIDTLEDAHPGTTIVGGLATGDPAVRSTCVFHGKRVAGEGAVVVALSGTVQLRPVVSQGCEPIGEVWTVTDADRHIVRSIGGRPAYEILVETVNGLDPETRDRVNTNLRVGLAMNEYRDTFKRGDFLFVTWSVWTPGAAQSRLPESRASARHSNSRFWTRARRTRNCVTCWPRNR
jgi:small ligand-binding sensory domain FIST